jgi:hypothetical protein
MKEQLLVVMDNLAEAAHKDNCLLKENPYDNTVMQEVLKRMAERDLEVRNIIAYLQSSSNN